MKYFLVFLLLIVVVAGGSAQTVSGRVFEIVENDTIPLDGAHVVLLDGHNHGALTDSKGRFAIEAHEVSEIVLYISHVSYEPDTVVVESQPVDLYLRSGRTLGEVVITARAPDTYIAAAPMRTEVITSTELEEAACCDLAGCFNRTASVENAVTDVLSDTKELRMLSIAGVYTQILIDNIPWMTHGLNQSFAVSHVPGTMIERIMVMKGLNSVLQGDEAISGQVNVITKPIEGKGSLFNAFANSFLESQYNLNYSEKMGNWSTIFAGHTTQRGADTDGNGDSFLDLPHTTRYMAFNKWTYENEEGEMKSYVAAKFIDEERIGGQKGFNVATDKGTMNSYGQVLDMTRLEAYGKIEKEIGEKQFLDVLSSFSTHTLDGAYGTTRYNGDQITFYSDVRYESSPMDENTLTVGAGFRYLDLKEKINLSVNPQNKTYAGDYNSTESVPGVFIEDQQHLFDEDMSIIAGLRVDNHDDAGLMVTPRVHLKYAFDEFTSIRASAGSGHRSAHVFAENLVLLASSRDILIANKLDIEKAMNFGVNFMHEYSLFGISGSLAMDFYRTEFSNQIRPVYDADPTTILFRNLDGSSFSNSFTGETTLYFTPEIDAKFAFTWSEVYEETNGIRKDLPFVPKQKVLGTFSWATEEPNWRVDITVEWFGTQKLPNTSSYPVQYQMAAESDPYTMFGFQVTKNWEIFDFYAGVENLLNHKQDNPIIGADDPFGAHFEPTFIWGDVKGREAYAGFRWRFSSF